MISVIKATGEKEEFSENKVKASIHRAGIDQSLQEKVLAHVKNNLHENITTKEIYSHIIEFLGNTSPFAKTKYSLKQAIMALGPTGYPFEDYLSKILSSLGYEILTRVILQGKCISHEIDVVAQKGGHRVMIEAKYHNLPGNKTDVHVAMYTKARFDDVLERNNLNQAWLITNTKLSIDAITYALCMGMKVTSWNYPEGESLRELIDQQALIPITALNSLSLAQKQMLLTQHIVLCKDLCNNSLVLDALHLSNEQKQKVIEESSFACNLSPKTESNLPEFASV